MKSPRVTMVKAALSLLDHTLSTRTLDDALASAADFESEEPLTTAELLKSIEDGTAANPIRLMLHQQLCKWDALPSAEWIKDTDHQTKERRERIYELLGIETGMRSRFEQLFPPRLIDDPGFTITRDFERWYEPAVADQGFYWPRYRDHLRDVERWGAGVEDLARATYQVVERLAPPDSESIYQARGLVVGYVQSGKTANFTGVVARAIDAGYRLVIILAGTTNLLRSQTQRRLDKQLIGREILVTHAAEEHYEQATDWDRFISYSAPPREQGAVDILRLTSLNSDYKRLAGGLSALEFTKHVSAEPFTSATNLEHAPARLVVAKKNRSPLESLAKDLRAVQKGGVDLSEIPALIIDDESDQASINTKKATKKEVETRTAINRAIVDLLLLLPRAQYVGYTATPFANVLTDPNDELGVYPRTFVLGLDRPKEYMGADSYHDFGERRTGFESNEKSYVRDVLGEDLADDNLRLALDLFLLTGAMKLYRAEDDSCEINIKHHTMLVHTSEKTAVHAETAAVVKKLIEDGGYEDGEADPRLQDLLEADLRPVSEVKGQDLPFPASYQELRPHIAACLQRLQEGVDPVLIVNGLKENEELSPDFDRDSVWAVLVGGTKLSRGYTVEGLTISYYRRPTRAADTLMQMGRWFGFRRYYEDLMRLFIGRAEGMASRPFDLYRAFEAVCHDEANLREELRRYTLPESGEPVTPLHVPLLVTQNLPELKPTAPNKMWNADQISENFGGKQIARTLAPTAVAAVRRNLKRTRSLLAEVGLEQLQLGPSGESFKAQTGDVDPQEMLKFLEEYEWSKAGVIDRVNSFLAGKLGDPEIDRWALILPMLEKVGSLGTWKLNDELSIPVMERARDGSDRFGVYTTPVHVRTARSIIGGDGAEGMTEETIARAQHDNTAVALMYGVRAPGDKETTVGFSLFLPENKLNVATKWGVHSPEQGEEPIIQKTGN